MMTPIYVDDTICVAIIDAHLGGKNVTQLQKQFGLGRRIIERILSTHLPNIQTKSDIIRSQFPILGDKDALVSMYETNLLSQDEIATKIGVSTQVIKNVFKELGIRSRPRSPVGNRRSVIKLAPELSNKEWMIEQYINCERSVNSIAEQLHVSDTAVKTALDGFNISRRSFWEQLAVTPNRGNEINSKLARNLRTRLSLALRGVGIKRGSAVQDLGLTIEDFKVYIESLFYADDFGRNMSWDNYGANGWELDHIIPLSSFDLSDPAQLKVACYYTNIQPLWRSDNRTKSSAISSIDKFPHINLIIVTGLSGSGKSWVCNQLSSDYCYIACDKVPKEQHLYLMIEAAKQGKHILYDPLRKPISILKQYRSIFRARLMVIKEPVATIQQRIIDRGGSRVHNIPKLIKKIEGYRQYAEFCGTSTEVLNYILSNKLLI